MIFRQPITAWTKTKSRRPQTSPSARQTFDNGYDGPIKPINKRAAAISPIKCQSVRAPRNPIVLRDSAISSSDIHATTKSSRFSRHRVPWAIAPSHARWPWPSARRISRPSRAAFYAQRHRPHQRASTRSVLTHSLTPPSLALSHHGIKHKQIATRNIIARRAEKVLP